MNASPALLDLAEKCGARITGKPDASEKIEIIFSIDAWRTFDKHVIVASVAPEPTAASPVGLVPKGQRLNEILETAGFKDATTLNRTCLYALLLIEAADELKRRAALSGVAPEQAKDGT